MHIKNKQIKQILDYQKAQEEKIKIRSAKDGAKLIRKISIEESNKIIPPIEPVIIGLQEIKKKKENIVEERVYGTFKNKFNINFDNDIDLEFNTIKNKNLKIAIVNIATGKYIKFIKPLYEQINKYFLKNYEKSFFLFSDINKDNNIIKEFNIHHYHIDRKGFPKDTLLRYHYFLLADKELKNYDYIFYLDADMAIVGNIGEEILPIKMGLVGVCHPGYVWNGISPFFESNNKSTAFLRNDDNKTYYAGGFNGGKSDLFLKMCKTIKRNVDIDLEKGFIARWHDESHMNKYFHMISRPKTLNPGYCYPESWSIPFVKKILALDKNHEDIRR